MFKQIAAMRHRIRSSRWCAIYFGVLSIMLSALLLVFVTFPLLNLPDSDLSERLLYAGCLYIFTSAAGTLLAYITVGPYKGTPSHHDNARFIKGLAALAGGCLTATVILGLTRGSVWTWPW